MDLPAAITLKAICPTWRCRNPQSSHAPPRRDRGGQNTCLDIPLAGVCRCALSRKQQWRLALSKLDFLFEVGKYEDRTGLGCEVLYRSNNSRHISQVGAQQMVHLVEIGGREFSAGRLAGCRSPFTESTLIALGLSQPAVVYTCTNLKV